MTEKKFIPFASKSLTAKLSEEEHNILIDYYNEKFPGMEYISGREVFSSLIKEFAALRKNPGSDGADKAEIQELKNQNNLLKTEVETLSNSCENYKTENSNLLEANKDLQTKLENAITAVEEKSVIPSGAVMVVIEPALNYFLEKCSDAASRKMNKEISRADILKNLFYEQIYSGPGDHLPLTWSKNAIRATLHSFKTAQQNDE